jgi:hypothetical protein
MVCYVTSLPRLEIVQVVSAMRFAADPSFGGQEVQTVQVVEQQVLASKIFLPAG